MSRRSLSDRCGGIGINDSPHIVTGIDEEGKQWYCPFYLRWVGMINRCYNETFLERSPCYRGCSISNEWLNFSVFYEWMKSQDWQGMHLDKDILVEGNRVYGPDFCVFVSPALNSFLTDRKNHRGDWPIGAIYLKDRNRFVGKCSNPFTRKNDYLGYFITAEEAHSAWKARKHQHACTYAEMQKDARVAMALRKRFSS